MSTMEWLWRDPVYDRLSRWWTIDPETGEPAIEASSENAHDYCLGECALDDVALVADALATEFTTKHFSDEEVQSLLLRRAVPASFRGGPDDAEELVQHVNDLWTMAQNRYLQAIVRPPNSVECRWLYKCAFSTIRARGGRPIA